MATCQVCGREFRAWLHRDYKARHPSGFEIPVCRACTKCSLCGGESIGENRVFDVTDSRSYCVSCWEARTPAEKQAKAKEITSRSLVNPFEGRFVVHEGEALKASIPASVPAGGISKGSLILTNQRLAIVGDTKGELGRTYELESINDIEAEFKRLPNRFATGINIILEDKGVLYLEVQFKAVDFGFDEFKLAFSNLRESRLRSRDGKVTVRKALSGDSRGIAVVHVDTWRTAYRGLVPAEYLASMEYGRSESMWERVLLDPKGGSVYVAEQGSDIVGFAAYGPERSSDPFYKGELYAIYVLAGKQRRGVGTQLLRSVAISLRSMGMESMIVWVLEDNPWGRFYESLQGRRVRNRETKVGGVSLTEVSYGWSDIDKLLALVETRLAGMEEKVRPDVMPVQNSADYPLM